MIPKNVTKSVAAFLFVWMSASQAFAQSKVVEASDVQGAIGCVQWQVVDVSYQAEEQVQNPFDRNVYAVVTGDDDAEQKIPLFYNGGNEWVFRYSSSKVGEKSFAIKADIKALDGRRGRFSVSRNEKQDRHGGIVLNEEIPNRFFHEDGTHYFNLAFECDWLFALDYGQADIPKTKHLLSLLNQHRFNQVVMNVYSYDVKWPKDERL